MWYEEPFQCAIENTGSLRECLTKGLGWWISEFPTALTMWYLQLYLTGSADSIKSGTWPSYINPQTATFQHHAPQLPSVECIMLLNVLLLDLDESSYRWWSEGHPCFRCQSPSSLPYLLVLLKAGKPGCWLESQPHSGSGPCYSIKTPEALASQLILQHVEIVCKCEFDLASWRNLTEKI